MTDLLFSDLEGVLHDLARGASGELLLVAPFIKHAQLRGVLECVGEGVSVLVVTRWRPDEVAAGVSDLKVFDLCREAGAELRLCDRLHAKLFVADGTDALVGSANLTGRGLGAVEPANLELLLPSRPSARSLVLLTAKLRAESRPASAAERDAIAKLAGAIEPVERMSPATMASDPPVWLPEFRSPDRIFEVYLSLGEAPPSSAEKVAIRDLALLDVPLGLDRAGFANLVRGRLRKQRCVARLDDLLSAPRRFGEISAWVATLRPEATHRERQHVAQTLLRWLTFFDGERYLDPPSV